MEGAENCLERRLERCLVSCQENSRVAPERGEGMWVGQNCVHPRSHAPCVRHRRCAPWLRSGAHGGRRAQTAVAATPAGWLRSAAAIGPRLRSLPSGIKDTFKPQVAGSSIPFCTHARPEHNERSLAMIEHTLPEEIEQLFAVGTAKRCKRNHSGKCVQ